MFNKYRFKKKKGIKTPGKKIVYIGKIKGINRIVCYEGIILANREYTHFPNKSKCRMVDKNIHKSNDLFDIILPTKEIKLDPKRD